ncbi:MAG: hypothetical protein RPU60_04040 [Candidatus Sedimenticola sp. (ex Thyasira tokunagai)]
MGVRITNASDAYDLVLMSELYVTQKLLHNINDAPIYIVSFAFRRYRVINEAGDTEYKDGAISDYVGDYYPKAAAEYAAGDPTLIAALTGNQAAVAKMISENTDFNTEVF